MCAAAGRRAQLLQLLLLQLLLSCGLVLATVPQDRQCDALRDTLSDKASQLQHADSSSSGGPSPSARGPGACGADTRCCPPAVQQQLTQLAQLDLRRLLRNSTAAVHQLLTQQAHHVQGAILRVIHEARERTLETFNGGYPASAGLARTPVTQLFAAFSRYFQSQLSDAQLEQHVVSFFDQLFPLAYKDAVMPAEQAMPAALDACLRDSRDQLRPFGDKPLRVQQRLVPLLATAKFYLQALHVGAQVLNGTRRLQFSESCYAGMVRHDYCGLCAGRAPGAAAAPPPPPPPPCMALCFNVLRGCVAPLSSLASTWRAYVNALARLSSSLQQANNVNSYLYKMNLKMTEGMIDVWNNKDNIQERAAEACEQPAVDADGERRSRQRRGAGRRRWRRQTVAPLPYSRSGDLQVALPAQQSGELGAGAGDPVPLLSYLSVFNGQIELHRDLFEKLPDATCTAGVVHAQRPCWNGTAVGEYHGQLVEVGLESQQFNPEVTVGVNLVDPDVEEMADRLDRIRQIALDKLMSSPSSDSLHTDWTEGSGSGGWQDGYDDEDGPYEYYDYYGDYGSGSGYGDDEDFYGDSDDVEGSTGSPIPSDSDDLDMEPAPGVHVPDSARDSDTTPPPVAEVTTTAPRPSAAARLHSNSGATWAALLATVALVAAGHRI